MNRRGALSLLGAVVVGPSVAAKLLSLEQPASEPGEEEIRAELRKVVTEANDALGSIDLIDPPLYPERWHWFESLYSFAHPEDRSAAIRCLISKAKELRVLTFANMAKIDSLSNKKQFAEGAFRASFYYGNNNCDVNCPLVSLDWMGM